MNNCGICGGGGIGGKRGSVDGDYEFSSGGCGYSCMVKLLVVPLVVWCFQMVVVMVMLMT